MEILAGRFIRRWGVTSAFRFTTITEVSPPVLDLAELRFRAS
jgi:hypothetical protein